VLDAATLEFLTRNLVPLVLFALGLIAGFAYRHAVSRKRRDRSKKSFHDSI
jgi:hypothetical protein